MANTTTQAAATVTSTVTVLQNLLRYFNLYGTFIILCPGIILNTISMLVFYFRKKFWRNSTMGFYYSIEALVNNLACCAAIIFLGPSGFGYQLQLTNVSWCQGYHIIKNVTTQFVGYYTILTSLDRSMKIVFRRQIGFFVKYRNICLVIVFMWLAVFASNTVDLWRYLLTTTTVRPNQTTTYSQSCTNSFVLLMVTAFLNILSRIIPTASNIVMTAMIIRSLAQSRSRVRSVTSGTGLTNRISYKDLHFAYNLVAMNIIYVACTIPNIALNVIQIYNYFANVSVSFSTQIILLQGICSWGVYLYTSSTFFVNLFFNKIFRSELTTMVSKERLFSSTGIVLARNPGSKDTTRLAHNTT